MSGLKLNLLFSFLLIIQFFVFTNKYSRADDNVLKSRNIVVTPYRNFLNNNSIASSTSVIFQEDIDRMQSTQPHEILQYVPGLNFLAQGNSGNKQQFTIRGFHTKYIRVLIDGIEVSDSTATQSEFNFASLMPFKIERIEVLRGSQGLMYGSEAVGGVINIISAKGEKGLNHRLKVEYGSHETRSAQYNINGQFKNFDYSVNPTFYYEGGISDMVDESSRTENDAFENFQIVGNLGYSLPYNIADLENIDIRYTARYMRDETDYDNFYASAGTAGYNDRVVDRIESSNRFLTKFDLINQRLSSELGFNYKKFNRTYREDGKLITDSDGRLYRGKLHEVDYQGVFDLTKNNTLVFGGDWRNEWIKNSESEREKNGITEWERGVFLDYQTQSLKNIFLSFGGRYNENQDYGDHFTFKISGSYTIQKHSKFFPHNLKLKGSIATGYRSPSLYEEQNKDKNLGGSISLKPEKTKSYEIGFEQPIMNNKFKLESVFFKINLDNRINWETGSGYKQEIGGFRSQGIETSLITYDVYNKFDLLISHTWNQSENQNGFRTLKVPVHVFGINSNYRFFEDKANLNLNFHAQTGARDIESGKYAEGGWGILNSSLTYDVSNLYKYLKSSQIYFKANNILDKKYHQMASYNTYPRSFYFGLIQDF